jgi:hypothetical protein
MLVGLLKVILVIAESVVNKNDERFTRPAPFVSKPIKALTVFVLLVFA